MGWLLLVTLGSLVQATHGQTCDCSGNAGKKFSGVSLNLFGIHWGEPILKKGIAKWENISGAKIEWSRVTTAADLEKEITSDLNGANFYDAYVCTNKMVPQWASQGKLADLTEAVRAPGLGWPKILSIFRETIAVYEQSVVTIPWDGDILMLYYRRDLAIKDGWTAPKTWEEYIAISKKYDGQDLNADGVADYGSCMCGDQLQSNTFYHWITPFLTMAQYTGPRQGAFLNMTEEGIEPVVDNEAFRETLRILIAAQGSYPKGKGQTYGKSRQDFADGRCALYITWPSGGPWSIKKDGNGNLPYMHGKMGVANVPGSQKVLDWATGKLVSCTVDLCPYALDPATGKYDGINKIAWYANGGMGTVVNNASSPERKAAIVDFLMWYAGNVDVTQPSPYNPFRENHFNLADYVAGGWDSGDARSYIDAEYEILNGPYSPNAVLDFRAPFVNDFFQAYNQHYLNLTSSDSAEVEKYVGVVHDSVKHFIDVFFGENVANPLLPGKLELERMYRGSLGLAMRAITEMCAPGTGYVETNAELRTGECRTCGPGLYGPGGENQRCLLCAAGSATAKNGSTACETCAAGYYAPPLQDDAVAGATQCQECPENTASGSPGQAICKCARGFFGPGGAECKQCKHGMTTAFQDARLESDCKCPQDMYWPKDDSGCKVCTEGLQCDLGSFEANIPANASAGEPKADTYPQLKAQYFSFYDDPLSVYVCTEETLCPGGRPESCAPGAIGVACGNCAQGYYSDGEACHECVFFLSSGLAFIPVIFAIPILILIHDKSDDDIKNWGKPSHGLKEAFHHALEFLQAVGILLLLADLGSVNMLPSALDFTSYALKLIEIFNPQCASQSDYYLKFTLTCCLPLFVGSLFLAAYFVSKVPWGKFCGKDPERFKMQKDISLCSYMALFETFFITIAQECMSILMCYKHPNGSFSVAGASHILCYEGAWNGFVVVAVFAILAFCVAPMALMIYIAVAIKKHIREKTFRLRYKFVLEKFNPEACYWCFVLLLRAFWMNFAFAVTSDAVTTAIMVFCMFQFYAIGNGHVGPWKIREIGYLDLITSYMTLVLAYLVTFSVGASVGKGEVEIHMAGTYIILWLTLAITGIFCGYFAYRTKFPPKKVHLHHGLALEWSHLCDYIRDNVELIEEILENALEEKYLAGVYHCIDMIRTAHHKNMHAGQRMSELQMMAAEQGDVVKRMSQVSVYTDDGTRNSVVSGVGMAHWV